MPGKAVEPRDWLGTNGGSSHGEWSCDTGKEVHGGEAAESGFAEYRLFEHVEEENRALKVLVNTVLSCAFQALVFGGLLGEITRAGGPEGAPGAPLGVAGQALAGCVLAAAVGLLSTIFLCFRTRASRTSLRDHLMGLALVGYHIGFVALQQETLSMDPSRAEPRGLELVAGAVLMLEAWLQPVPLQSMDGEASDRQGPAALATVLVGLCWTLRGMAEDEGPEGGPLPSRVLSAWRGYASRGLMPLGVAVLAPLAFRQVGQTGNARGQLLELSPPMVHGLLLCGNYGVLGAAALAFAAPSAREELLEASLPQLALGALSSFASLGCLLFASSSCSPSFASRIAAFTWAAMALLVAGRGGGEGVPKRHCWFATAGFAVHFLGLVSQNRERLREAASLGRFSSLPRHVIGAQAVWDRARVRLCMGIWQGSVLWLRRFVDVYLPKQIRVYACPIPIFNLGPEIHLGIAAHYAPRRTRGQEPQLPRYFVCNVGQIVASALGDIQKTMNNLLDVWEEFKQPDMQGLIANVVAVFPYTDQRFAKEINLSVWESGEDAYQWYVRSEGHKKALHAHSSGLLRTFGNMLASLQPAVPVQHQERCRVCARVIEGEPGKLASTTCPYCGGQAFGYPVF